MVAIIVVIGFLLVYFFIKVFKLESPVVVDENSFSHKGLRIDFKERTITIKNFTYNVDLVTGIYYETREPIGKNGEVFFTTADVKIQVEDFNKPVHSIRFIGPDAPKKAEEFMQRITMALRKAGGPSFV